MTSAQVVEISVNVTSNSPSQDYTHPDDHNSPNYDMTPGFKPFTPLQCIFHIKSWLYDTMYEDQESSLLTATMSSLFFKTTSVELCWNETIFLSSVIECETKNGLTFSIPI